MNRKNLLLLLAATAAIAVLAVGYARIRAEPVDEISRKWELAGHSDRTSRSFVNWDGDDPPQVPPRCAKCHSTYGYLDFLGHDGTAAGTVDGPAPTGSVLYCNVCHNPPAHAMTGVVFPSGAEATGLGPEASCMQCHQGRASSDTVEDAIAGLPDDQVSDGLGFINVHYAVGAATKMGAQARGAYQYPGRTYAGPFEHAAPLRTCAECHDPHSLQIAPRSCSPCHFNVVDYADLRDIRTGKVDYDGDGDAREGVEREIAALHQALYRAMQDYAATVVGTPIAYAAEAFPYFVVDADGDGRAGPEEAHAGNRYPAWTPRLVRTAYNYHYVQQDPGAFAHNPRYILQILYDSLSDLGQQVPVDVERMARPSS